MYRFDRAATVLPGKMMPTVAWAQDIAGHITANHGITVSVAVEVFGSAGGVHWISSFDNLAQWEELNLKMIADEALQAKIAHAGEYLVEAATNDTLLMVVPAQ